MKIQDKKEIVLSVEDVQNILLERIKDNENSNNN